jgi:hypothetical protein
VDIDCGALAVKTALKVFLGTLVVVPALCVIAIGPVALFFPAYIPVCLYVYVVHPLSSYPLLLAGSLLACVLGGLVLSRWHANQLRYAAVPGAAMGLAAAWLTPGACGFDALILNTFAESVLVIGIAALAALLENYETRIHAVLALFCGIAISLQVHVGLCHRDYMPDAGLILVSGRSAAWLAIVAGMALGWFSAWLGTRIDRVFPPMRESTPG